MGAARHDSQVLNRVLRPHSAGRDVWVDAAYRSQSIDAQRKRRQLRSRIQYKGSRNISLIPPQRTSYQRRACICARVEHVFGHHVMVTGGKFLRTVGLVRARAKLGLQNLAYNFHRVLRLTLPTRR
ncbi:MAG: hypothetical protein AB7P17_12675 [Nitrospirales bacterium]